MNESIRIAVVIPCYRAARTVLGVIASIGAEVDRIYVVDDDCPESAGDLVRNQCTDERVRVLVHEENQGVGGAVMTGYKAALEEGMDVAVKLDADGQMDPKLILGLVRPLALGSADYVKGNRFHHVSDVRDMPWVRLFGNAALSFLTKLSSGYWQMFDPTNGFTAVHRAALESVDLDRVARRYFFESDLLYHLNQAGAVVAQMPMRAVYEDEVSSLSPGRTIVPFAIGHLRNFCRRLFYSYFLRGFSVASLELLLGPVLVLFGTVFGMARWGVSIAQGEPATAGTVMVAALPVIVGTQLILSWLNYDIASEPDLPLQTFATRGDRGRS
jgi:glycosyltransferase involved in cell wall biosynthesis